ncbi:MAG: rubredoxin [Chromatiales bacterium]|nr:rubredoxin [Chromatiales bacterium]
MKTFEGSYLGDDSRIPDDARMECKICWYVYDPAEGDEYWQIPPGTPFSRLPGHWRCPECDGAKDQFMVVQEGP